MPLFQKSEKKKISEILREKVMAAQQPLYMPSLRQEIPFQISPSGNGVETERLPHYVMEWAHFDAIVAKANAMGGKMYRGDELVQIRENKLGEQIPLDCMEGFISSELLLIPNGTSITRRSTYYSGVLAWAGIITIHGSKNGEGRYITVNNPYRNY